MRSSPNIEEGRIIRIAPCGTVLKATGKVRAKSTALQQAQVVAAPLIVPVWGASKIPALRRDPEPQIISKYTCCSVSPHFRGISFHRRYTELLALRRTTRTIADAGTIAGPLL